MFKLGSNNKIGEYLRKLIKKKYPSERQLCRAYLEINYNKEIAKNEDEIRKTQNRFSQIFNGKKSIQISDLPAVTELLGASCEEILSAGKVRVPVSNHLTNYNIAFSKKPEVWQSYIDREDKLILNYDEYGKSVLDYAFEFGNYGLLKYLVENGYIIFHDISDVEGRYIFGADTTIKRRGFSYTDTLEAELGNTGKLRINMIELAMMNEDFSVLETLHARETPMLTFASLYNSEPREWDKGSYERENIIEKIASAPDTVIDYFLTEYSVLRNTVVMPSCFIYQYLGKVIEAMIRNGNKRVLHVIKKATEHNQKVKAILLENRTVAVKNTMERYHCSEETAEEMIYSLKDFYDSCDVLRVFYYDSEKILVANIIRAEAGGKTDPDLRRAVDLLNASYDEVRAIAEER